MSLHCPVAKGPSIIKIMGIDPGSDTTGVAVLEFDLEKQSIIRTRALTIIASEFNRDEWLSELYGDRFSRYEILFNELSKIFQEENPLSIGIESPFFNPKRPQAYGVLMEVMTTIRRAIWHYDRWRVGYLIDPSSVKNAVGAKGNANKDVVREHMLKLLPMLNLEVEIESLDEHSIDAIAVGYTRLHRLLNGE